MKKTLVAIITTLAVAASSYGQGTVTFNNSGASLVKIQTSPSDPTLISMPVGGGHVELLWAVPGTIDVNLFSSVAITDFHTAPGRFSGGAVTIPTSVAGGAVDLVIRGWTGSSLTWGGVNLLTDQTGYSSIFSLAATGNPTTVPAGTPVAIAPPFAGVNLQYTIPEPTSMALAGLGAASLLMFRRRK